MTSQSTQPLTSATLGAVNMEAENPLELANFWAEVTGGTRRASGDNVYLPPAGPGGFAMFLQPLMGPRPDRNAIHLDITVPWGSRARTVERLLARGATHHWDVLEEHEHVQWSTLADPEGNLFCVAEHPPAARG
jgi:hypothetical protein